MFSACIPDDSLWAYNRLYEQTYRVKLENPDINPTCANACWGIEGIEKGIVELIMEFSNLYSKAIREDYVRQVHNFGRATKEINIQSNVIKDFSFRMF